MTGARPLSNKVVCKYDAVMAKAWRSMWRKGFTLKEISESYGVSITTINRWLSKEARGELK